MSRFWRIIYAFFLGMFSFTQASHSTCTHRPAVFTAHFEGENGPIKEARKNLLKSVLRKLQMLLEFAYGLQTLFFFRWGPKGVLKRWKHEKMGSKKGRCAVLRPKWPFLAFWGLGRSAP